MRLSVGGVVIRKGRGYQKGACLSERGVVISEGRGCRVITVFSDRAENV